MTVRGSAMTLAMSCLVLLVQACSPADEAAKSGGETAHRTESGSDTPSAPRRTEPPAPRTDVTPPRAEAPAPRTEARAPRTEAPARPAEAPPPRTEAPARGADASPPRAEVPRPQENPAPAPAATPPPAATPQKPPALDLAALESGFAIPARSARSRSSRSRTRSMICWSSSRHSTAAEARSSSRRSGRASIFYSSKFSRCCRTRTRCWPATSAIRARRSGIFWQTPPNLRTCDRERRRR